MNNRLKRSNQAKQNSIKRGRRNASISIQLFVSLSLVIAGLGICSQSSEPESRVTLDSFQDQNAEIDIGVDPLALTRNQTDFELLAVSADQTVIGYTSVLSTGKAAASLINHLQYRGWHADEIQYAADNEICGGVPTLQQCGTGQIQISQADIEVESINSSFALMLSYREAFRGEFNQMIVQLFPTGSGCSIVIKLF